MFGSRCMEGNVVEKDQLQDVNGQAFSDEGLVETKLEGKTVYPGSFFSIEKDTVRLPDGSTAFREFMRHPGAAAMIPLFEDGTVLLERQFRYPVNKVFWELPAGKIDAGESSFETAKRELAEETGYEADEWYFVTTIHNAIGYSDEHIDLYLAKNLKKGRAHLDSEEFIEVVKMPIQKLVNMIRDGQITDVKTIVGIFWLEKIITGQWNVEKMA